MRLPEKPPSKEELNKILSQSSSSSQFDELRPYLNRVNEKYLHWDELQIDSNFKGKDLRQIWALVNLFREFNERSIPINGLILRYVQTPHIEKALHDLDVRVGGKVDLDGHTIAPDLHKKYLINSLMEEAIASSQLEGATTSRIVAKEMLRENRKPRDLSEQMILNNYLTMKLIRDTAQPNQKLTLDIIKAIHKQITANTLENKTWEGVFRTDNEVKVYSREDDQLIHEPPDHTEINKLLTQTCEFINNEPKSYYIHPFVKAIILHYLIGYVHPFNDGNGRTARALFYWYVITQNYDKLEYVAVSTAIKNAPSKYMRAYLYVETDNNDVTYFVNFNLRAIDIALSSFEKYVDKTVNENKKIFETIRHNPALNFRQADIIITLGKSGKPITTYEMQQRYNITYQTARSDLLELTKKQYMSKIQKGKQFYFVLNKEKCMSALADTSKKTV